MSSVKCMTICLLDSETYSIWNIVAVFSKSLQPSEGSTTNDKPAASDLKSTESSAITHSHSRTLTH